MKLYSPVGRGTERLRAFGSVSYVLSDKETYMSDTVSCPFCGDDDFDLIGLKIHLELSCDEYRNTNSLCKEPECPFVGKVKAHGCGCARPGAR